MIPIALIYYVFFRMPLHLLNTRFLIFTNVVGDHWFDRQSIEQDICLHINKCCIIKYALEHNFFKLKKKQRKKRIYFVFIWPVFHPSDVGLCCAELREFDYYLKAIHR